MSCEIQPARHNHQPTHQQGTKWASNGQKCQIWAKFGGFWAKNPNYYWRNQKFWDPHKGKPTQAPCSHWFLVRHWTKCAKMANLVIFGQKILFFTGEIKSFVTHISENPPRHLVHIVFWSGIGQNVQKMAKFGQKWPKMQILDQIWPFLGQKS